MFLGMAHELPCCIPMFEVRSALRSLIRRPSLSITIFLSLALGLGLLMAVLSIVDTVLLRPLPYPHPDQIVVVAMSQVEASGDTESERVSYPDYLDWQENNRYFSNLAAISEESFVLSGSEAAKRIDGARVTSDFFGVLGLKPVLGTVPREGWQESGAKVAVLSHRFWEGNFGKDSEIIGKSLRLDDQLYTIVGVMPPRFDIPNEALVWLPLDASDPRVGAEVRSARYLQALARLREGVDLESAARDLRALSQRLAEDHPENRGYIAKLIPLREKLVGDLRPGLLLLSTAVGFVLLTICINVAGMLVADGIARSGDMWVRLVLGASSGRLARHFLAENLILALTGGGAGLLAGIGASRLLVKLYPQELRLAGETMDIRGALIAAGLGIALTAGMLVSFPSMLLIARKRFGVASGKGVVGLGRISVRTQAVLLVLQLGVTLALLNAASLMLHSIAKLLSVDPGFRAEGLLTARISLPSYRYSEPFQRAAFFRELLQRLKNLPDVESTAAVTNLPFSGSDMLFGFSVENGAVRQVSAVNRKPSQAHYRAVSPEYFRTLGVPLVTGRFLEVGDEAGAPPVVVVNQAFARRFLPDSAPLGRHIRVMFGNGDPVRVVGVVGDLRHSGLGEEPEPEMYVPYTQQPWAFMTLVVRTGGDPQSASTLLRSEVAGLDPDQPVDRIETMEELIADSVAQPRFYSILLGAFALLGLAVSVMGVYGLTSYWVNLRRREIGIHVALGASRSRIQGLFLRKLCALALPGVVLGETLIYFIKKIVSGLLYDVSPYDSGTLLSATLVLLLSVVLAAWLPALRASGVDPAMTLHNK
jgi:putative ABC transport system permease protein